MSNARGSCAIAHGLGTQLGGSGYGEQTLVPLEPEILGVLLLCEGREETRRGHAAGVATGQHPPSSIEGELEILSIMSSSRSSSPSSSPSSEDETPPFCAIASASSWFILLLLSRAPRARVFPLVELATSSSAKESISSRLLRLSRETLGERRCSSSVSCVTSRIVSAWWGPRELALPPRRGLFEWS